VLRISVSAFDKFYFISGDFSVNKNYVETLL
jgi:hypothetical protein